MNPGLSRIFRRRMGQDIRAWPMLALLLLVVLVAIGCVAWFMREAIRNERLATQGKLATLYQTHLELIRHLTLDDWQRTNSLRFARFESAAGFFAQAVRSGWVDSLIVFGADGRVLYPQLVSDDRVPAANEKLLALEKDPTQRALATELRAGLEDYSSPMPAPQRRFLMRAMQALLPETQFPTLAAEELAARYLEAHPDPTPPETLRQSSLPGVWEEGSAEKRSTALYLTDSLRHRIAGMKNVQHVEEGLQVAVSAPGDDPPQATRLASVTLAPMLRDWRLSIEPTAPTFYSAAAEKQIATHLWVGSAVIAAMTVLATFIARGFGRQVQFARLKNDLVANVSHELKTPLTAMRALVDTLLDAEKSDEKTTREYLQLIAAENTRLSRLIDNFLTFSRLERNKFTFDFTRIAPHEVVTSAIAAMGERRHAIKAEESSELPTILGDSGALTTALLNLLDNAWKYSGDEKQIVVRTEQHNGSVAFAVEDHGIGLTPAESRRIFDRFYQTDQRLARSVGGCGLGLSIVQSIVAAHRGTVQVASEPGRGSTFTIEIPAAP